MQLTFLSCFPSPLDLPSSKHLQLRLTPLFKKLIQNPLFKDSFQDLTPTTVISLFLFVLSVVCVHLSYVKCLWVPFKSTILIRFIIISSCSSLPLFSKYDDIFKHVCSGDDQKDFFFFFAVNGFVFTLENPCHISGCCT